MNLSEARLSLYRELTLQGASSPREVPEQLLAGLSHRQQEKWLRTFWGQPRRLAAVPRHPRLVNHFALGADPEFGMLGLVDGERTRIDAHNIGLKAGLPFGADNNGRLVEMRPAPSRFALDVVASMLVELRWFYLSCERARPLEWRSAPYFVGDGLGGHVHFGRKRNLTTKEAKSKEVEGLDTFYNGVTPLLFSRDALRHRQGAPGHYGQNTDVRVQRHGYEYRSWPTWLESPWLAYFHLVMAKLLVLDPKVLPAKPTTQHIRNILSLYKGRDDDAAIALHALNLRGLPKCAETDFRVVWGIPTVKPPQLGPSFVEMYPSVIAAQGEEREEVYRHLVEGAPVPWRRPVPYWKHTNPPDRYVAALAFSSTLRQPGIGELLNDLVLHREHLMVVKSNRDMPPFAIGIDPKDGPSTQRALEAARKVLPEATVYPAKKTSAAMQLELGSECLTAHNFAATRRFLLSGLFPIWRCRDVEPESVTRWEQANAKTSALRGRILEVI